MSTVTTLRINSVGSVATEQLAEKIGARLRGGEVVELVADLGGGKTTFTRGLVRGAGSTERVASPTFTLSREYKAPRFTIEHFDFYRLSEAGAVGDEFDEFVGDPKYVVVTEWSNAIKISLPSKVISVEFKTTGENDRIITIKYPEKLQYLVDDFND